MLQIQGERETVVVLVLDWIAGYFASDVALAIAHIVAHKLPLSALMLMSLR